MISEAALRKTTVVTFLAAVAWCSAFGQRDWRVHERGLLHQSVFNTGELGRAYNAGGTVQQGIPSMEWPPGSYMILDRTTQLEEPTVERVWDAKKILELREVALAVPISEEVQDYAIRIVMATQPSTPLAHELTKKYLRYGASPRGAQTLIIGSKVLALLAGRSEVAYEDVRKVVLPALRHRVILNFEGEAERVDTDNILKAIVDWVPEKSGVK